MPISPPDREALAQFDPVFVTDDDLDDLASFTGMTREACLSRLRSYSMAEHSAAWRRADPRTPDEILAFYTSTDLYIWELMQWHASPARAPYWAALRRFVETYPPQAGWSRVYDFGCGVGTDALFLASKGYQVTAVDVGGPTLEFARHRSERRGLDVTFLESSSTLPEPPGTFDAIVCFDVFEHLHNPLLAARLLIAALRQGGLILQNGNFSDEGMHPCHLKQSIGHYAGLRWHIQLAVLGLRNVGSMAYRKVPYHLRLVQLLRYALWRFTGLWLVEVGRL